MADDPRIHVAADGPGQREMKAGRTWMWISGSALVLGVVFVLIQLSNSGEVSGRTVVYAILSALGLARGFVLYREGLGRSRGNEPKVLIKAGNEKKAILWIIGIGVGLLVILLGGAYLFAD